MHVVRLWLMNMGDRAWLCIGVGECTVITWTMEFQIGNGVGVVNGNGVAHKYKVTNNRVN